MAFNPFVFEPSIYARLNTGVVAAASQGVWNTKAPPSIKTGRGLDPFIIFELISGTFDPTTFVNNIASAAYRVSVYDHADNGIGAAHTLIGLVFGDSAGTDNNPTYGLARWSIPAVAGAAKAMMKPAEFGTQNTEDQLHYWLTFEIEIQEA